MKRLPCLLFTAAGLYASTGMAAERVALVIGEASYQSGSTVPKALADTGAIAATLEQLDFETTTISDATRASFVDELAKFSERAAGADIAVLYYSGHGISVGQDNYLLPADIKLSSDIRIRFEAIALEDAIAALGGAKARLALINLPDNNLYLAGLRLALNNIAVSDSFAPVNMQGAPFYMSQAKTLSPEGDGLSPYATAIIEAFAQPGADLGQSLGKVGEHLASLNLPRPVEYGALPTGIVLVKPESEPTGPNEEIAGTAASTDPEDECDRLAGNPNDPMKSPDHAGIEYDKYLSEEALKACEAAMKLHPDNARYLYQAGRALNGLDRVNDADGYFERAQRLGSVQATVEIGRFIAAGIAGRTKDAAKAEAIFEQAAARGSTDATTELAGLYLSGELAERDIPKALGLYRGAYEKGNARAAVELGQYYLTSATEQNYPEALVWFKRAAEKNTGAGFNELGDMFEDGRGVDKNPAMAINMYLKAAAFGARDRAAAIAEMYDVGSGVPANPGEATKWYLKAGPEGEFQIAQRHQFGTGVPRAWEDGRLIFRVGNNPGLAEASTWYTRAAEHGYPRAQWYLAFMYQDGLGVEKDISKTLDWYRKAAASGYVPAMVQLGNMYFNGSDVPEDRSLASEWYLKATEKGNTEAMAQMAEIAESASPPDYRASVEWYMRASAKGDSYAMRKLGSMYERGLGARQNYAEALKWYRKAAEAGDSFAMNQIGAAYANGAGIGRDDREAGRWYEKAATAGNDYANRNLAILFSRGLGCKQDPELAAQLEEIAIRGDTQAYNEFKTDWSNWHPAFLVAFQKRLSKLGLYDGAADGHYGKGTLAAIDALHELGKE